MILEWRWIHEILDPTTIPESPTSPGRVPPHLDETMDILGSHLDLLQVENDPGMEVPPHLDEPMEVRKSHLDLLHVENDPGMEVDP
ncbi:hypothetical protein WISP_00693 [Willisornis vidua]|uniref:Uncharacterized protein n=1 Tax=Willisornis vidua TaxID=1566151 RepID=A0ABQ9E0W1_9PASS|nr:hypothetical protein WISP_00693 [Willisornis vidua]